MRITRIGGRDLGVDEDADERAEERAAAVEPAAGALGQPAPDLGQGLLRHRVELGLDREDVVGLVGEIGEAGDRDLVERGQLLERLGPELDLLGDATTGPVEPEDVDLVPQVEDDPALEDAERDRLAAADPVDPHADDDRRREAAVEVLVGGGVEDLGDVAGRDQIAAALGEAHALELGRGVGVAVVGAGAGRMDDDGGQRGERGDGGEPRAPGGPGHGGTRPRALAAESSKMPTSVSMRSAGVEDQIDRQRPPRRAIASVEVVGVGDAPQATADEQVAAVDALAAAEQLD